MTQDEFNQNMRKMKDGDKEGLKEIYTEYLPYIYTIIYGILQSKENAEDVASEFFIKLWNIADTYHDKAESHRGFLATIARNMAIDFLRKNQREVPTEELPDSESQSSVEQQVLSELSLQEALQMLKENEKQIVGMKVLSDMTFQEIAKTLKIPLGTVTWRYRNAMSKLRSLGYE